MGGIGQYFHGEEGEVARLRWAAFGDMVIYRMELRGNPHRSFAQAYGSDIAIDPILRPGDTARYVRLDKYCGVWVRPGDELGEGLETALSRQRKLLWYIRMYLNLGPLAIPWAMVWLPLRTRVPVRLGWPGERPPSDAPATRISIFVSYSSREEERARRFCEELRKDARAEIWFAADRSEEAPQPPKDEEDEENEEHQRRLAQWLEQAIFGCQAFLLVLTEMSVHSEWVRREIRWAAEKQRSGDFHLICLKLDAVAAPALESEFTLIDCRGLSPGEIAEELYAAVYRRRGRREWLREQAALGRPSPYR